MNKVCWLTVRVRERSNCIVVDIFPLETLCVVVRGYRDGIHILLDEGNMFSGVHYFQDYTATVRSMVVDHDGVDGTHEAKHGENHVSAHFSRFLGQICQPI